MWANVQKVETYGIVWSNRGVHNIGSRLVGFSDLPCVDVPDLSCLELELACTRAKRGS